RGQARGDQIEIGARGRDAGVVAEPADHVEPADVVVVEQRQIAGQLFLEHHRDEDLFVQQLRAGESGSGDADHDEGGTVDVDGAVHDRGVGGKRGAPQPVADDDRRYAAAIAVRGAEGAAERRAAWKHTADTS